MAEEDPVQLPQPLFIVSDGTGETAERVVRAALRQFQGHIVHVRTYPHVSRPEDLEILFRRAARKEALVVSTLVTPEMRAAAVAYARDHDVLYADLLGPLMHRMEGFLDQPAVGVAGLMHQADERYFLRVEAVEFTVKADDGKEPRMLRHADLVLVGVSRTSKTPLSTFLAHKGFKVGNVPIVLDRDPPKELFRIDQRRVFALTIDPEILRDIRETRLRSMGVPYGTNYGDLDYILAELEYANDLFRAHPEWPVVDVTNKAVEETAGILLRIFNDRGFATLIGEVSQL